MPRITVHNLKGEKVGTILLPKEVFDIKFNPDLVHQTYVAQISNARQKSALTKTRAERRGGGRKPWRQKGTGRARAGSIRSPLWRKGGVTFGPQREKIYKKKINKKVRRKALFMVLSSKVKDKELVMVDKLKIPKAKTKEMIKLLNNLIKIDKERELKSAVKLQSERELPVKSLPVKLSHGASRDNGVKKSAVRRQPETVLIATAGKNEAVLRASKNIGFTKTVKADSLNIVDLLNYKYLLMPKEAVKVIKETYLKTHNT